LWSTFGREGASAGVSLGELALFLGTGGGEGGKLNAALGGVLMLAALAAPIAGKAGVPALWRTGSGAVVGAFVGVVIGAVA
jgi:hypothetical protein